MLKKELEAKIEMLNRRISFYQNENRLLREKNDLLTEACRKRFICEDSVHAMSTAVDATAHVVSDLRQLLKERR